MMKRVKKGIHKCHNRERDSYFLTFNENSGYIYIPVMIRRIIDEKTGCRAVDIYVDYETEKIIIKPYEKGEYALSDTSSGYKVCLYSVRDCGISPGRHNIELVNEIDGLALKVDFRASENVREG